MTPPYEPVDVDPEAEILLCCGRRCLDSERCRQLRALVRGPVAWARLLRLAFHHGLSPLLRYHLRSVCRDAVPPSILDQLTGQAHAISTYNLVLERELIRLLSLLEASGISAVPYKGPVLGRALYGSIALRPCGDLDLLVQKKDLWPATDRLCGFGYVPRLAPGRARLLLKSQCEYTFRRADGAVLVDLHWTFASRYFAIRFDCDRLWERVDRRRLGDTEFLTLAAEDLLFALCVHGVKHLWSRLKWICDIAALIASQPDLDWDAVLREAHALRVRRLVLLGLYLAHDLLKEDLPAEVVRHARADASIKTLAAEVRRRLFFEPTHAVSILNAARFHLRARESLGDRLRYCVRFAIDPTEGDVTTVALPSFLSFGYYFVRPVRLLRKYGPTWNHSSRWDVLRRNRNAGGSIAS